MKKKNTYPNKEKNKKSLTILFFSNSYRHYKKKRRFEISKNKKYSQKKKKLDIDEYLSNHHKTKIKVSCFSQTIK